MGGASSTRNSFFSTIAVATVSTATGFIANKRQTNIEEFNSTLPKIDKWLSARSEELGLKVAKGENIDELCLEIKKECGYPQIGVIYYFKIMDWMKSSCTDLPKWENVNTILRDLLYPFSLNGTRHLFVFLVDVSASMYDVVPKKKK